MKKYISSRVLFFYMVVFSCLFVLLSSCKKNAAASGHSPFESKFSFTYNGNRYVLPFKEGTDEWGIIHSGLFIYRPDLFGGDINFPYANCAYLDPHKNGSSVMVAPGCQLSSSGLPIDSVAVYLYQSGSVAIVYKNCYQKKEYDPFTNSTIAYDVCDADGTFDLTLRNKEGKTITITDGTFVLYSFRR